MADKNLITETPEIPHGFCQCGCGQLAPIATQTNNKLGFKKGLPKKYILGHHRNHIPKHGANHPSWRGGKYIHGSGYILVWAPDHHRAYKNGHVFEHILVAEEMLGRPLNKGERVHHIDEIRHNNYEDNLYVFCTRGNHNAFHARLNAFKATGHWHWHKCWICKQYDAPENMNIKEGKHRNCDNEYNINRRKSCKIK